MHHLNARRVVGTLVALAVVAASCSSGGSSVTKDELHPADENPAPYVKTGPYAVGYTDLNLAGGRRVVVWYPVAKGKTAGHAQEQIDIAGFLNPDLQAKVPAADRVKYPAAAFKDAPARVRRAGTRWCCSATATRASPSSRSR